MSPATGSGIGVAHPLLLVLTLLLAAGFVVAAVLLVRRRTAAMAAAGARLIGGRGRHLGLGLSLVAVVVLAVAAAGPAASLPVGRSAGTVILAIDASNSMSADDVAPSRLAAAQQAASAFVDAQPDTVDIGVVGFDQGALTTSLPTADRTATKAAVQNLRTSGGTSLAAAITGSLRAITGKPVAIGRDGALPDLGYWGSATIVLFSDGEDSGGGAGSGSGDAAMTAAGVAQKAGVHIETVGLGTVSGTTVEVDGYQLRTALDSERLTQIATASGGTFHPASSASDLDDVASTIDLRLTVAKQDVPLAGGLILVALVLLGAGALLSVVRTGRVV